MKIALVSNNGTQLSRHFGRARSYVVVTVEQGREVAREVRAKPAHKGRHDHGHDHDHDHEHDASHSHSQPMLGPDEAAALVQQSPQDLSGHGPMLTPISDCAVVISGGMGAPMAQHIRAANIQPILTAITEVEVALAAYLAGTLEDQPELIH